MTPIFNFSTRRVAGIRFLKIGRLCVSLSVARSAHPIKAARPTARAARPCIDLDRLTQERADLAACLLLLERSADHA